LIDNWAEGLGRICLPLPRTIPRHSKRPKPEGFDGTARAVPAEARNDAPVPDGTDRDPVIWPAPQPSAPLSPKSRASDAAIGSDIVRPTPTVSGKCRPFGNAATNPVAKRSRRAEDRDASRGGKRSESGACARRLRGIRGCGVTLFSLRAISMARQFLIGGPIGALEHRPNSVYEAVYPNAGHVHSHDRGASSGCD
jgi:hypothetical protein